MAHLVRSQAGKDPCPAVAGAGAVSGRKHSGDGKVTGPCVRGAESKPGSASLTSFAQRSGSACSCRAGVKGTGLGPVRVPQSPGPSQPSQMIGATADGYLLWA
jgi:hypothetical protein